jgi:hypothetical protein
MRIYYHNLKPEAQDEIFDELMVRLADEERDYIETARDIGMAPHDYLAEKVGDLINTRNYGVDMDF